MERDSKTKANKMGEIMERYKTPRVQGMYSCKGGCELTQLNMFARIIIAPLSQVGKNRIEI